MSMLNQSQVRLLGGFGGSRRSAYVFEPENIEQLRDLIQQAGKAGRKVSLRGSGRSYGDAAVLSEEIVVDCRRLNALEIDAESGVARVQGGATLEDLWRTGLPLGWWPPVVPGTMFPTIGGALAMNIHGKNDFRKGTLGEHVSRLELIDGEGRIHTLTDADPEIRNVVSSAGLLGAIVSADLKLSRVKSGLVDVEPIPCRNWDEQFEAFGSHRSEADYMVSWIDAHASGAAEGRGLFHSATHIEEPLPESLASHAQELPSRLAGVLPKAEAWRILRRFQSPGGIRFLNSMKHLAGRFGGSKPYRQSLAGFSFLLDYAPGWQRAYGEAGFIQYQCFVPEDSARATFGRLFDMQRQAGRINSLCVMKRHRRHDFMFAHGVDGYSLAMDFAVGADWAELQSLCWAMNDVVLDAGGRFYLAKDSTLRPEDLRRWLGEEGLARYCRAKDRYDRPGIFHSALAVRLQL